MKAQCEGFHKAFVVFLAAGNCFISPASAAEGQVCVGRRRYSTAGHIQELGTNVGLLSSNQECIKLVYPFLLCVRVCVLYTQ